jgi:hydrophobic/amphiphilic exporter-1 (mainly G- bacteria), HAE1 family
MNASGPFIRRPVMTTIVMGGILFFGGMSYRLLPVNDLPNVDFPTIQVSASLPGANPETMASSVATPLEKQFATIAGVDSMTSSSAQGSTSITLQFALNRNIDAAAQDVQAAIARATRQLPRDMPYAPTYRKVNPADQPILFLSLTSPTLPLYELDEYGETMIAQRISMISGVAQVQVYGGQKYAVRIKVDPRALVTRNLAIEDVTGAVQGANVNLPTGILWGPDRSYTIQTEGQLLTAERYRPIVVAYRDGKPVRLAELGTVYDSVENDKVAAWFVDERAIMLAVQRQPGTNTVEVVNAVKKLLPMFEQRLPASVKLAVMFDRSESIDESVGDVKLTLLITLVLVVLVIFLFLRNLSATVIPSLAMPMSIVGTFVVMYLLGYSLDNLSLMALTLSVGFVVDDAIVMLENIVRHMEMGKPAMQAALDGAQEIGFTIVSMTISLAAVFIPVLFMGGIIGRLFGEFAVTIGVAVLISGFISLSLTPMLSSRFLRPPREVEHHKLYNLFERGFAWTLRMYETGLRWSLDHGRTMLVMTLVIMGLTYVAYRNVALGFIPSQDIGQITVNVEAIEGISFEALVRTQAAAREVLKADPNVDVFMNSAGGRGGGSANSGNFTVRLKPRQQRELTAEQVVEELRPKLARIAGLRAYVQSPPAFSLGGRQSRSQYQLTLQGPDTAELYRAAPDLEAKMRAHPLLVDVSTDLLLKNPQIDVAINRDKAASLGVTVARIEDTLYSAYGTRQISTIFSPDNDYPVILEVLPALQNDMTDLSLLYVRSSSGTLVPLDSLVSLKPGVGPLQVNHSGQAPSVTLSFNLAKGVALGNATAEVERLARETLPQSISYSYQGTAQAFQSSMQGLGLLLVVSIVVIFMVLGILYESFIHPFTILSALPLAGLGALLTLMAFGVELNIYAYVGIIMLVGLVKKNGIIMIDFAVEAQRAGRTPREAIYEACVVRFRPIMMTTMAALFGTLPIALGFGAGAEARQPLGLAVVGGLLLSQSLTLFITPVVFVYADRLQHWLGRSLPFLGGRGSQEPAR